MQPAPVASQVALARRAFAPRRPSCDLATFRSRYAAEPTGFLGFCDLLEIKPKDATGSGRVPFVLTPIQRAYCAARTARDVILKPRQVKITSIELARDLWYFLTKPGVAVRVLCQSSTDHSMLNELSERVGVYLASLQKNAGLVLEFATETRTAWTLANGASLKIVEAGASKAAAEKKERGATVHRIHTTELSRWEYAGATLGGMLEAVGKPEYGTEIVHESTPYGMGSEERGNADDAAGGAYFYWLCQDAKRGAGEYAFHFFSWMQEPEYATALLPGETVTPSTDRERQCAALGASPQQLKWYRAKVADKGQANIDQEYALDDETCFLVSGRPFFDRSVTSALFTAATDPLTVEHVHRDGAVGTLSIFKLPTAGARYVIPADTSEGTGGDRSGGHVYERGTGEHCATLAGQFKPGELATELAKLGTRYNNAEVAVERNNHGHACLHELARTGADKPRYPAIFHDTDGKPGWYNVEVKRVAALDALEAAHRTGQWRTRDRVILGEFRTFVVSKTGKAEAARGAHDDHVIMAAIGWDRLRKQAAESNHAPPPIRPFNTDDRTTGW